MGQYIGINLEINVYTIAVLILLLVVHFYCSIYGHLRKISIYKEELEKAVKNEYEKMTRKQYGELLNKKMVETKHYLLVSTLALIIATVAACLMFDIATMIFMCVGYGFFALLKNSFIENKLKELQQQAQHEYAKRYIEK